MNSMIMIAADLVAIALLTLAVYFPRHHRRDLVVALLGVNVGVLAVSMVPLPPGPPHSQPPHLPPTGDQR